MVSLKPGIHGCSWQPHIRGIAPELCHQTETHDIQSRVPHSSWPHGPLCSFGLIPQTPYSDLGFTADEAKGKICSGKKALGQVTQCTSCEAGLASSIGAGLVGLRMWVMSQQKQMSPEILGQNAAGTLPGAVGVSF